MSSVGKLRTDHLLAAATSMSALASPLAAHAVNTFNTFLSLNYTQAQNFALPGDIVRMQLTLGTGAIQGGTSVNINRVRFELDCDVAGPVGLGWPDEEEVAGFSAAATQEM